MTRKYTKRTETETETAETVTGSDNTEDTAGDTEAAETPEGNQSAMAGREATDEDRTAEDTTEES